ncbi:MAG: hypothetical protein A3G18_08055 [Rhodospirillales bacterium RIFCSPLOWO2_12_FULL_58_28]|nr:MAG: hypothetical protein A3H92_00445 [Rhodospirillales bacterium RIFCSPLOWO2_02_FULL_58_16]OHC78130.1 MAG: hypothetical protein A3G18_08055 [Rhodospirillales bacterium RIFCSPLOWO2_12_FULL_58_28]
MADSSISVIDIGVGVVLLISAVLAYARGFVHEVLSIAGWIGATFAAIYGFPLLKPHARAYIPMEIAADLTAGTVIFIVSLAALSILTRSISKMVQDSALNALDRSLGFLFGLVRGAVLACLVFIAANLAWPLDNKDPDAKDGDPKEKRPAWIMTSRSLPLIRQGADMLAALVPKGTIAGNGVIEKKTQEMRNAVDAAETLRKMTSPDPKAATPEATDTTEGYDPNARRALNKMMEIVK